MHLWTGRCPASARKLQRFFISGLSRSVVRTRRLIDFSFQFRPGCVSLTADAIALTAAEWDKVKDNFAMGLAVWFIRFTPQLTSSRSRDRQRGNYRVCEFLRGCSAAEVAGGVLALAIDFF
jgi:hypothetical protein